MTACRTLSARLGSILAFGEELLGALRIFLGSSEQAEPRRAKFLIGGEPRVHPSLAQLQLDFTALIAIIRNSHRERIIAETVAGGTKILPLGALAIFPRRATFVDGFGRDRTCDVCSPRGCGREPRS